MDWFIPFSVLVVQIGLGVFVFAAVSIFLPQRWGAPWVITPRRTVEAMLRLGGLQPGEKLVDLGAGDGRIVVAAARRFQARAVGVEIDPLRCLTANLIIRLFGLHEKARVYYANFFDFDFSDADVLTLYLTRETNKRITRLLEDRLRPGSRVVSHAFPIPEWTPTMIDDALLVFAYEVGNTGPEVKTRFA